MLYDGFFTDPVQNRHINSIWDLRTDYLEGLYNLSKSHPKEALITDHSRKLTA